VIIADWSIIAIVGDTNPENCMSSVSDQELSDVIVKTARDVFSEPDLAYSRDLIFRDILGFDSVLAVQYILAIEESCGVTLVESEVDDMHTMGILFDLLRAKNVSEIKLPA
jgi:acyl carrier protein